MLTFGFGVSCVTPSASSSSCLAWDRGDRAERAAPRARFGRGSGPAAPEQLVHLRGHPAVGQHALGVVVDHENQRVRLRPGVGEQADRLVTVSERVRVQVAVPGHHRARVLGPAGPRDAALDQPQRGVLRQSGLAGGAQAGDTGQQRQCGRARVLARVLDESLADQFVKVGALVRRAGRPLAPPGPEQLADHQLGVERAAHREQFPGCPEHLLEQGVWWGIGQPGRTRHPAVTGTARASGGVLAAALRTHPLSFPDPRRHGRVPRDTPPVFLRGCVITSLLRPVCAARSAHLRTRCGLG